VNPAPGVPFTRRGIVALRRNRPAARLACLAYLNALAPPERVRPAAGLSLEYALIGRCFRHPSVTTFGVYLDRE
jgi:hypothetical protein